MSPINEKNGADSTDPLVNPAISLEDTFDSFTPATLEDMIAQQNKPVMVSNILC